MPTLYKSECIIPMKRQEVMYSHPKALITFKGKCVYKLSSTKANDIIRLCNALQVQYKFKKSTYGSIIRDATP